MSHVRFVHCPVADCSCHEWNRDDTCLICNPPPKKDTE
jgi:hypothetical protein